MRVVIQSELSLVSSTCQLVIEYLPFKVDEYRLELALTEALNNAILHGNNSVTWKKVTIEVLVTEPTATIKISDEGGKLLPEHLTPLNSGNIDSLSGRGLGLIAKLVDSLEIKSGDLLLTVSSQE